MDVIKLNFNSLLKMNGTDEYLENKKNINSIVFLLCNYCVEWSACLLFEGI